MFYGVALKKKTQFRVGRGGAQKKNSKTGAQKKPARNFSCVLLITAKLGFFLSATLYLSR